jgi:hypothetical protein
MLQRIIHPPILDPFFSAEQVLVEVGEMVEVIRHCYQILRCGLHCCILGLLWVYSGFYIARIRLNS